MSATSSPPGVARWLLSRAASQEDRADVVSDLDEEFQLVASSKGLRAARRWYRSQCLRSLAPLVSRRMRSARFWPPRTPLRDLSSDVRFSLRSCRNRPGFSLAAVGTLALGFGAHHVIYSVVRSVRLRDFPYLVRATVSNLVGDDTTTFTLGAADIDETTSPITESGSVSGATHTQDKTLTLANHTAGQIGDQFTIPSPITTPVFRFRLSRSGAITVDTLRVNFTTGGGVASGDVTAGELWVDANNDGVINGGDTAVQTGVAAAGGVVTFTTNFQPSLAGTNYLVRVTVSNLVADDTTTFTLGLADIDTVEAGVFEVGSTTGATHTQDRTLVLANHDSGQTTDKFTTTTPVTDVLYAFKLSATVTVDTLRLSFTTALGVANGDVTGGELWIDANNDGVINGVESSIQTGVTPSGGVLTFTNNFVPGTATNYLVRATVANLTGGDTTTFSLGTADIDEVEGGVVEAGSASNAVHVHDGAGGIQDVYFSVGTSVADLKTGAPTITISAGTATLTVAQTGDVGVGDVIDYGSGNKVYVRSVTSQTELEVRTVTGGIPANTAPVAVNSIRRVFNTWQDAVSLTGTGAYLGTTNLVTGDFRVTWMGYDDTRFDVSATTTVSGYVTDATHYLTLTAAAGPQVASGASQRHQGASGGGVRLRLASGSITGLAVTQAFTRVHWLEIDGNGQALANGIVVNAGANDGGLEALIVRNLGSVGVTLAGANTTLRNCFVYDTSDDGIRTDSTGVEIQNCTVFMAGAEGVEIQAGGNVTVENVISVGSGTSNFHNDGTLTTNNNLASDGTATSPAGVGGELGNAGNLDNITPTDAPGPGPGFVIFQSLAGRDLHLRSDPDNTAVDAGKNLSAFFNGDIDGGGRADPWDIGADDIVATTAVALVAFDALPLDGAVDLRWETGSEIRNLGFHLYRAPGPGGPYERITPRLIPGLGSSPTGARYSYRDEGLTNGTTYYYELEDVETTGASERHGPVSAAPYAGASLPSGPGEGDSGSVARITYGEPGANGLRVLREGKSSLVLELVTEGFYVVPQEDGSVALEIPGFEAVGGAGTPSLPVKHQWVDAIAGRKVELVSVQGRMEVVAGAFRLSSDLPELVARSSGTVAARRRRRMSATAEGLFPREAARIVTVAFQGDAKKALFAIAPLRWAADTGELLMARRLVVRVSFERPDPSERSFDGVRGRRRTRNAEPSPGVSVRLAAAGRGLYGIRYESVFSDRGSVLVRSLRLSRQGKDVPFHVEPDRARFQPGSTLYFVSDGGDANPYGREAVYELQQLSSQDEGGARMDMVAAAPFGEEATFYWKRLEQEQNRYYQAALLDAPDRWLWDLLLAPVTKSYPLEVTSLAGALEPGRLEVWLQGTSDTEAFPDHHVRVHLNGSLLSDTTWNGKLPHAVFVDVAPGVLVEGENALQVENVGDTAASYSTVMLDRFALTYPRRLIAEAGELDGTFGASGTATGLSVGPTAHVIALSGETPRWLVGGPRFGVEAGTKYLVVDPTAVKTPQVRRPRPASLRSLRNRAEYVVIGPSAFVEAAKPLLVHRAEQGLASRGIAIEDVFAEFGHGESRPEAIRDFLEYAYHEWQAPALRYVVLLGDGSYDYKDYSRLGSSNPVPPLMVETSYLWTASDPALAAVNGDDLLPDVAIGRLPASSVDDVRNLVEKILAWESNGYDLSGPVVLVADNPDAAGNFVADAEAAAARLPAGAELTRVYLGELGASETKSAILAAFDRGASLLSYVGHGGIHLWADENLFHIDQIDLLAEQQRQPLLLTMSCLNGYFHLPHFDSLSEELVSAEGKGAIAAFSPSGLSLNAPAQRLHQALLDEVFSGRHSRLGDAVLNAQENYLDTGAFPELLAIFHLFGDPALKLR